MKEKPDVRSIYIIFSKLKLYVNNVLSFCHIFIFNKNLHYDIMHIYILN